MVRETLNIAFLIDEKIAEGRFNYLLLEEVLHTRILTKIDLLTLKDFTSSSFDG